MEAKAQCRQKFRVDMVEVKALNYFHFTTAVPKLCRNGFHLRGLIFYLIGYAFHKAPVRSIWNKSNAFSSNLTPITGDFMH